MAATIRIEVVTSGGVDAVKKDIEDLGRTAEKSGGGFSAMREVATGALRAIGEGVVGLALKGFQTLSGAVQDGIADARQNAQIQAQTAAVLKSTGNAAGTSAEHIMDYASALSDASGKSLFGDDQIQQSTNLLLTFTEIKGATLDAATAISVDMAQALGGEPKDAAIQLGKALNDPVKGITALTRVGVTFSEEQKAQIQAMQEAGDTAGAQKVILNELNKEFGGSAEAAAKATGGWSEFNGRMGEAKEAMGAALLPLLNQLAGILNDTVLPVVESVANAFKLLTTGEFEGGIFGLSEDDPAIGILFTIREVVQGITTALKTGDFGPLLESLQHLGEQLTPIFNGFIEKAASWIASAIPPFLEKAGQFLSAMLAWIQQNLPLWEMKLKLYADAAWAWIISALPVIGEKLGQLYNKLVNWVVDSLPKWMAELQKLASAAIQWVTDAMPGLGTKLGEFAGKLLAWIVQTAIDVIPKLADLGLKFITWVATDVIPKLPGALLAIATGIYNFITEVITAVAPKLVELATKFINWVQTDVLPKLPGALESIKDAIGSWISSALSWVGTEAGKIGGQIIDGVISGVEHAASFLYDKLKNIASSALSAAKDALGISSPSSVFADEVGAPIMQGLIQGVQGMLPGLEDMLNGVAIAIIGHAKKVTEKVVDEANKIQDDLLDQASGIADKLSGVMADALMGTASLDRAKAKAIAALKDISAAQQEEVQKQLAAAAATAGGFGDPKQAAAFFKQRSDQIFELAKLRDQIEKTTDEAAKARLIEQYNLIGKAQQAELQAFDTKSGSSALQGITAQLQKILGDKNLPSVLDDSSGVLSHLFEALPQLVAMTTNAGPSAVTSTNSSSFVYSPTISSNTPLSFGMDYATAKSLAGV